MMDLDEAIQHCEEVAEENEEIYEAHCRIYSKEVVEKYPSPPCKKCADEHRQLAAWLKELKAYRDARAEINQALYDDTRGEQNDYERGRKSGIFLCESIISVKLGESRSENPNTCEDAISRQAVLEAIEDDKYEKYSCFASNNDAECFKQVIRELPSVTSQQRTGRWIPVGYDGYADGNPVYDWWECSECGWEHTGDEESLTAFCPSCGTKMEVEE